MSAFDIEVFYDGACPLCAREVRMLQGLDPDRRIRSSPSPNATNDDEVRWILHTGVKLRSLVDQVEMQTDKVELAKDI